MDNEKPLSYYLQDVLDMAKAHLEDRFIDGLPENDEDTRAIEKIESLILSIERVEE